MITKILLNDIATYSEPIELNNLKKVNFFFGSNGSGKSVLAKVIDNPNDYSSCQVMWENNSKLKTIVYNEDFVRNNFYEPENLKGIYTIGEGAKDIEEQINLKRKDQESLNDKINELNSTKTQKEQERTKQWDDFKDMCWNKLYQKYQNDFDAIFIGYKNSKQNLADKILQEVNNQSSLKNLNELKERYNLLYKEEPIILSLLPNISSEIIESLKNLENRDILKQKIIGKEDVDISKMIHKLQNHDWVRQGKIFYEHNYDETRETYICPFCQQPTSDVFKKKLESYFDETYENQVNELKNLINEYEAIAKKIYDFFNSITSIQGNKYLEQKRENIKNFKNTIDSKIQNKKLVLRDKEQNPSREIEINSIVDTLDELNNIINSINKEIANHNSIVKNISNERDNLTPEIWNFFYNEIKTEIDNYTKNNNNIEKVIKNIAAKIEEKQKSIETIYKEISKLESQIKSVRPTIEAINKILDSFGFKGFRLQLCNDGKHYEIIRDSGELAKNTLSEGERNFIVFLYFYHLVQGVLNPEENINDEKVVVLDDPVSSFDSDVLFIVSTLIKDILRNIRKNESNIKQVFILTHNVFFFKEVSFISSRELQSKRNDTNYYIIRKINNISKIESYDINPIRTTYQLLWDGIKKQDENLDCVCLQNSMRRIIEFYFNTLGNLKEKDLFENFKDCTELNVCRSLIAWINVGSHEVFSSIDYSPKPDEIAKFKNVFKRIFEITGQLPHYNMMMGISEDNNF